MLKAKNKSQLCISKAELKRRMAVAQLSVPEITELMIEKGWGFYPNKLYRPLREKDFICLDRAMMNDLLGILREGAN
ncbi:unnamed protein product [marine sediment metagenome]|uniref:Uncharacterized protein n=1 Tax=marine sediment metagenome TaxID=412755 RepID=X1AFZ1_9ZZZZ